MKQKILCSIILCMFIVSVFSCLTNVSSQVVGSGSIDSGLVGYWRLDENSGVSALDSSGNGRTATISGASWVNGVFGSALSFDGSNDVVTIPTPSFMNLSVISLSFWLNTTAQNDLGTTILYDINNRLSFNLASTTFSTQFILGGVNHGLSTTIIQNALYHVVLVVDATQQLYMNGSLVDEENFGHAFNSIGVPSGFYLMAYPSVTQYESGFLDEFRVYNRALFQQEITELYSGYFVDVAYDVGSLVSPNGTYSPSWNTGLYFSSLVNVGVDQFQEFIIGAKNGYVPALVYWNNIPYSTSPLWFLNNGLYGLQGNATLYVTSQFIGFPDFTPTITPIPNLQSGSLADFFSNFDGLTQIMVIGVIAVFVLIASLILLTKKRRFLK